MPLFVLFVLVVSVRRRSWRPAAYAGLVLVVAGIPALATKVLLRRTDPHHELSSIGGFPSGHTLVVLVCLGAALLLVRRRPTVWEWLLVLAADAVMAWAMLCAVGALADGRHRRCLAGRRGPRRHLRLAPAGSSTLERLA